MIPESRSPTKPPTSHLPLPAPSELPACSKAWGRVRGQGWTEDIHEYPGSWSEPASSPELLSGAGGRPPTPDTRSGVQLLTWPTVFRETAFVRPVGRKPRNDMASAPAFPLQAVRGPRRLPIQNAPLTTSAPIPAGSTPLPRYASNTPSALSPGQQSPGCPSRAPDLYPRVTCWASTLPTSWELLRPGTSQSRSPTT